VGSLQCDWSLPLRPPSTIRVPLTLRTPLRYRVRCCRRSASSTSRRFELPYKSESGELRPPSTIRVPLTRKPPLARPSGTRCALPSVVRSAHSLGAVLASSGPDRASGPFQSTRTPGPRASPADSLGRSRRSLPRSSLARLRLTVASGDTFASARRLFVFPPARAGAASVRRRSRERDEHRRSERNAQRVARPKPAGGFRSGTDRSGVSARPKPAEPFERRPTSHP